MMERADDVVRKIDQNQYTNFRKINVTPAMGLEVAKCMCVFSNQDENNMESWHGVHSLMNSGNFPKELI